MTTPNLLIVPPELDLLTPLLGKEYRLLRHWQGVAVTDLAATRVMVCLGHQSPGDLVDRMPLLELVACFTTGYDGIDVAALRGRGIAVTHAPGATAAPVAEFALALIFAAYRNVVAGDRLLRAGEWSPQRPPLLGRSLRGARLGIVGLGAIGTALAERCEPLGMQISWWGPREKPDARWPRAADLVTLASECDILAVCTSADASNTGLISAEVIDALGPEGLLLNVARGQLVDEDALIDALRAGRLGGAALDVFAQEPTPAERWKDVPNAICTPHIAGASMAGLGIMADMLRANLAAFFAGEPLPNPVRN